MKAGVCSRRHPGHRNCSHWTGDLRTTAGYAYLADAHLVEAAEQIGPIIAVQMRMRHTLSQ